MGRVVLSVSANGSSCHILTCEFPPQVGGVADFTRAIAVGLADRGTKVHVWSPEPADDLGSLAVHPLTDGYRLSGLAALSRQLDLQDRPRRLLIQWVPHGFGYNALNLPFCLWVLRRAQRGDTVDLVVHEPFLPFAAGRFRQNVGAVVHRVMLAVLLRAATTAWVSTPSFVPQIRGFGPRRLQYRWLPVPSPIGAPASPSAALQRRSARAGDRPVVGYFGTANPLVFDRLQHVFGAILARRPNVGIVLLGRGTDLLANALRRLPGADADTVLVGGEQPDAELSTWIQCCDLFVQPYPDGLTARRTTAMALLAHGAAVVASSAPRTEPFWGDAVVLTPNDDDMVDRAVALLDAPERRRAMSTAAAALYTARFDVNRAVDLLTDVAHG